MRALCSLRVLLCLRCEEKGKYPVAINGKFIRRPCAILIYAYSPKWTMQRQQRTGNVICRSFSDLKFATKMTVRALCRRANTSHSFIRWNLAVTVQCRQATVANRFIRMSREQQPDISLYFQDAYPPNFQLQRDNVLWSKHAFASIHLHSSRFGMGSEGGMNEGSTNPNILSFSLALGCMNPLRWMHRNSIHRTVLSVVCSVFFPNRKTTISNSIYSHRIVCGCCCSPVHICFSFFVHILIFRFRGKNSFRSVHVSLSLFSFASAIAFLIFRLSVLCHVHVYINFVIRALFLCSLRSPHPLLCQRRKFIQKFFFRFSFFFSVFIS